MGAGMAKVSSVQAVHIVLDAASPIAPYEQVRTQLAEHIIDRRLPVGARLATVRGLADELGLAPNTVARAYRELEIAGLVQTRGRNGTFVSPAGDNARKRAQQAAEKYAAAVGRLGISPVEALDIVKAALHNPL